MQRRWSRVNPNKTRPFCQRYYQIPKENEEAIKKSERAVIKMDKYSIYICRTYVDAVINHMAGQNGEGSAGSSFEVAALYYAGVPYYFSHFTPRNLCPSVNGNVHI